MLGPDDETDHLTETLIFTLSVIIEAGPGDRHRIAKAYSRAQNLAESIPSGGGSARPKIVACIEQFRLHKDAEEIEAAGWMLAAIQERIAEKNLPDWEKMQTVAEKAAQILPDPRRSVH
jgi:hypothetical protein